MAKINFSDAKIRTAKAKDKEWRLVDQDGLICRIFSSGRKSFCWRYQDAFNQKKLSRVEYGDYPDRSVADAKAIHQGVKSARNNGKDVKNPEILSSIIQSVTGMESPIPIHSGKILFCELVDRFFREHIEKNNIGPRPYNRIKNHLLPVFKDYPAEGIPDQTIKDFIAKKRLAGMKERTLSDAIRFTCSMYEWAEKYYIVDGCPFQKFKSKRPNKFRKQYYSTTELRTLLLNEDQLSISKDNLLIQKGLILTGCRRTELIHAEISEFDFGTGFWTIPPERVKNQNMLPEDQDKTPFILPMSTQFSETIREAISYCGNTTHIFGSKKKVFLNGAWETAPTGILSDRNYNNYIGSYRKHYGVHNRTNHDLRRTLETHLTNLGVNPSITTAMTGHSREGMSQIYNQAQQIHVLRTCFQLWADFLDLLCESDPVYARNFDNQIPSKELKAIYESFNFNHRLTSSMGIFE